MNKPLLTIDVAKNHSVAATYLSLHEPLDKPFMFPHTPEGLALLVQRLQSMEDRTNFKPEICLEATGNYSKALSHNLLSLGYHVVALNPLETHEQKKRSVRKVKTDKVDTHRIAQVYYLERRNPLHILDPNIAELRSICRHYDSLTNLYTETQLRLQSILDLVFPTFTNVFSRLCGDTSLNFLSNFPTPDDVLNANKKDLMDCLNPKFQKKTWSEETYTKLIAAAKDCLPYKVAQQSNVRVLREYVQLLMTHKKSVADVRAQIIATAKTFDVYHLLRSIPGVGEITAAIILSEIENINLFATPKQLIAFAGIDPSVNESGKYKSTNNTISKRGSSYLRKALFQAASMAVRKTKSGPVNPFLYDIYLRKISEGKPKMICKIAVSNKLCRVIHGMWRKHEPFTV